MQLMLRLDHHRRRVGVEARRIENLWRCRSSRPLGIDMRVLHIPVAAQDINIGGANDKDIALLPSLDVRRLPVHGQFLVRARGREC
jgi:hypothetical protein